MTTIGPRRPEMESVEEYIDRIVRSAGRPNPEQLDRLVTLLRSGRDHRAPGAATSRGNANA